MVIRLEMLVQSGEREPTCDDEDTGDKNSPKIKHEVVAFVCVPKLELVLNDVYILSLRVYVYCGLIEACSSTPAELLVCICVWVIIKTSTMHSESGSTQSRVNEQKSILRRI
jgi:hypothetical protein